MVTNLLDFSNLHHIYHIVSGTNTSFGQHCDLVFRHNLDNSVFGVAIILFNEKKKKLF
jgi:hypothetical protein